MIDDLLFSQPVNLPLRFLRLLAPLRRTRATGVSVVIVNFNSIDLIETVVPAVRAFSPPGTEIIVVDNASKDASWAWLRQRPHGIRAVRLLTNVGHGRALDLGIFIARSPVVITLDSDAFPFSDRWVETLTAPLSNPAILASGSWGPRDRLHPACAAYRRNSLLELGVSFHNFNLHKDRGEAPVFGVNTWDTGELISEALGADRMNILPTDPSGRGWGTVMAAVVYHHTGMTTGLTDDESALLTKKKEAWRSAVAELLGQ